jgi:two-component sensor histidine kinase/ABC-type amino acid transport substrate-binding protein
MILKKKYFLLLILSFLLFTSNNFALIKVGGDNNFPPYEFINSEGNPDGFNIDILKAVFKVKGIDYTIELDVWNIVRTALENKEIDMISGMVYSEERAKTFDFSSPFIQITHTAFVKDNIAINSIDDLKDLTIIVQKGDIMHDYAIENNLDKNLITLENPAAALQRLAAGTDENAVVLMGQLQGMYFIETLNLKNLSPANFIISSTNYCFSTYLDNRDLIFALNEGLDIIIATKEYHEIREKWFGKYDPRPPNYFFISLLIISPILIIVIIVLFINYTLKKVIKVKTKELKDNIKELKSTYQELQISKEQLQEKNKAFESTNQELEATNEEFASTNEKLLEANKEKKVLLQEIHHRVKNNMLLIKSMLVIQKQYLKDETAIKIFDECEKRIHSMALIHESLYRSNNISKIVMSAYIQNLLTNIYASYCKMDCSIEFETDLDDIVLSIEKALPIGLIVNEVLSNSLKHAFPGKNKGKISIIFKYINNRKKLIIKDNGIGFPKEIDINSDLTTYGLKLISILNKQIKGKLEVFSENGTEFVITFD